jgi:hypothetical protein
VVSGGTSAGAEPAVGAATGATGAGSSPPVKSQTTSASSTTAEPPAIRAVRRWLAARYTPRGSTTGIWAVGS